MAGGTNLYTYAGNDPVNGRDPSGLYHCVINSTYRGHPTSYTCYFGDSDCGYGVSEDACGDMVSTMFCEGDIGGTWQGGQCVVSSPPGGSGSGRATGEQNQGT